MKKNNKKRNRIMLLLILLLAISVGFALLSTTLKINGTTTIAKQGWNVYWSNVVVNQQSVNPATNLPVIGEDQNDPVNTKVTWSTTLTLPGDFYEFTVDATNAGTVDAMITDIDETLPSSMPSCVNYSVTYADGVAIAEKHLLPKATVSGNVSTPTTETYKIRVEIDPEADADDLDEIPAGGLQLSFEYDVTYSQADDSAIPKPIKWSLPEGKTANTLSVGDEICSGLPGIDDQCFNFIKYDGNNIVMLAKYNLNVGSNVKGTATNMQDSDVKSACGSECTTYGDVEFSETNYWAGNVSNYPAVVYDATNYAGVPGDNDYSVAYYVEAYKDILETAGVTIESARLLTHSEATDSSIGCDGYNAACPTTGFITNTSFWLGSASGSTGMLYIAYNGQFNAIDIDYGGIGVRPVIVVAKSNL